MVIISHLCTRHGVPPHGTREEGARDGAQPRGTIPGAPACAREASRAVRVSPAETQQGSNDPNADAGAKNTKKIGKNERRENGRVIVVARCKRLTSDMQTRIRRVLVGASSSRPRKAIAGVRIEPSAFSRSGARDRRTCGKAVVRRIGRPGTPVKKIENFSDFFLASLAGARPFSGNSARRDRPRDAAPDERKRAQPRRVSQARLLSVRGAPQRKRRRLRKRSAQIRRVDASAVEQVEQAQQVRRPERTGRAAPKLRIQN